MSTTLKLYKRGVISPPKFVPESIQYETLMGSTAYGVSSDSSDIDIYGFCIPPKGIVFPHLKGEILGFGKQLKRFDQFQQHHVYLPGDKTKQYDLQIFNIVKYFQLCMENNPNMIDSLFVPENCVLACTKIGNMVRDKRKIFLHKGSWYKYKGYAFSQLRKIDTKSPQMGTKRRESVEKFGYDVKFAYHVIRLISEVEQILSEGDLDIQRNREQLKYVKGGNWSLEEVKKWFYDKEKILEELYLTSSLQYSPDENEIKKLLLDCLEEYYGSLDQCITESDESLKVIEKLSVIIETFNRKQTKKSLYHKINLGKKSKKWKIDYRNIKKILGL